MFHLLLVAAGLVSSLVAGQSCCSGIFAATDYGAKGDGKTDDTDAINQAIAAATPTGGIVSLGAQKYLISGCITVPSGVTVKGINSAPLYIEPQVGTIILATGGRDNETAAPLFRLISGAVQGLTVYYPDQKPTEIHPYSWTFECAGGDDTIQDITLINSYNAIHTKGGNVRHMIRNVYGTALRRGVFIDSCTDIGRVENVHFHCHYWSSPAWGGSWDPVFAFMWQQLEAFIFARTDWEYVIDTFVFPAKIGYRFINSNVGPAPGAANGQFTGIGADATQSAVVVEDVQPMGLLISNGQFVAFNGANPTTVVVNTSSGASVRFSSCAFWGPSNTIALITAASSAAFVSFENSYFSGWGSLNASLPAIDAQAGRLQVRGCSFSVLSNATLCVRVGSAVKHAIVAFNNGDHGVRVQNDASSRAVIQFNEDPQQHTEL